jgi:tetratricopeptide (TPR) repeat protein
MPKKISLVFLLVLIGLFLVVLTDAVFADVKTDQKDIRDILTPYEAKIRNWEFMAGLCFAMTIIVAVLGVLTGTLQKAQKDLLKNLALVFGIAISIITVINSGLSKGDYRSYVSKGRKLIDSIKIEIIRAYPDGNEEARKAWLLKIDDLCQELSNIRKAETPEVSAQATSGFTLASSLYAQATRTEELPLWLSRLPSDPTTIYFVGMGENANLEKAKALSQSEAKYEASIVVFLQFERVIAGSGRTFDSQSLALSMLQSAEISDTYFQFSKNTQRFRFYSLLTLNKERMTLNKRFYAIEKRIDMPSSLYDFPDKLQGLSEYDFQKSLKRQDYFMSSIYKDLSPDELESFWEIHQSRLNGISQATFGKIEPLLLNKPSFYFGWFEKAADLNIQGDNAEAERAYQKAFELERALPFRDFQLVIAYAGFLNKQKRNKEAIDMVAKAIQNDPNNGLLQIKLESLKKSNR